MGGTAEPTDWRFPARNRTVSRLTRNLFSQYSLTVVVWEIACSMGGTVHRTKAPKSRCPQRPLPTLCRHLPSGIRDLMALLEIEFPYGADGRFACSVTADQMLLHHAAPPPVASLDEQIRNCLAAPLEFPALSQGVLPGDRIVIALDDRTPGASALITGCWDVLASVGIAPSSLLIVQPGSAGTTPDPRSSLPADVARQVRLMSHNADDSENHAYLASTTSGERIYLTREVVEADFLFCVGAVAYDPLLGYRGTSSVLYPGLSNTDTIRKSLGQGHDELGPDDVRGLRQTIDEVGWLLGVQFALQVVPAGRGGVAEVIAGAGDAVFRRGKQRLAEFWEIETDARSETVVVAVDDMGDCDQWGAIGGALETARQLVSRDGRIVVLTQANAPLSPGLKLIRDSRTPRDALQPLRMAVPNDVVAATQLAKAVDWAKVYFLSRLEDDLVEDLFMIPLSEPRESGRIIESSDSIAFVESAPFSHGRVHVPA